MYNGVTSWCLSSYNIRGCNESGPGNLLTFKLFNLSSITSSLKVTLSHRFTGYFFPLLLQVTSYKLDPAGGALQRSPDLLAGFKGGATSKGRKANGREGKEEERKEGDGKGKGDGKGRKEEGKERPLLFGPNRTLALTDAFSHALFVYLFQTPPCTDVSNWAQL